MGFVTKLRITHHPAEAAPNLTPFRLPVLHAVTEAESGGLETLRPLEIIRKFSRTATAQLKGIAGDEPEPNFTVVLSALVAALSRLTNQNEIVIGVPLDLTAAQDRLFEIRFQPERSLKDHLLYVRDRLLEIWQQRTTG